MVDLSERKTGVCEREKIMQNPNIGLGKRISGSGFRDNSWHVVTGETNHVFSSNRRDLAIPSHLHELDSLRLGQVRLCLWLGEVRFVKRTCKPNSKATLSKAGWRGPLSGVAKRNASWASLKRCEELWMWRCADSSTVRSRTTSPVKHTKQSGKHTKRE